MNITVDPSTLARLGDLERSIRHSGGLYERIILPNVTHAEKRTIHKCGPYSASFVSPAIGYSGTYLVWTKDSGKTWESAFLATRGFSGGTFYDVVNDRPVRIVGGTTEVTLETTVDAGMTWTPLWTITTSYSGTDYAMSSNYRSMYRLSSGGARVSYIEDILDPGTASNLINTQGMVDYAICGDYLVGIKNQSSPQSTRMEVIKGGVSIHSMDVPYAVRESIKASVENMALLPLVGGYHQYLISDEAVEMIPINATIRTSTDTMIVHLLLSYPTWNSPIAINNLRHNQGRIIPTDEGVKFSANGSEYQSVLFDDGSYVLLPIESARDPSVYRMA